MSALRHTYLVVLLIEDHEAEEQRCVCTDWRTGKFAAYGSKKEAEAFRDLIAADFPQYEYDVIQLR